MTKAIKITAEDGYNLSEIYDRILDGHLGFEVDENDLERVDASGAQVFASGGARTATIVLKVKDGMSEQEIIQLQRKLREMFGDRAQIHIDA